MFNKMKGLMEMQKKMREVKRELENANFDIESSDKLVKITMNAAQEVKEVFISEDLEKLGKMHLESSLKDTFNRGIKRAQEIAAQKMKDVVGLDLPGLK